MYKIDFKNSQLKSCYIGHTTNSCTRTSNLKTTMDQDLLTFQTYYRKYPSKYGYLQCLADHDRENFQREMIRLIRKNCPTEFERMIYAGYINLSTWCKIMSAIPLSHTYQLWRPARWNEYPKLLYSVVYHVPIQTFHGNPSVPGITPSQSRICRRTDLIQLLYTNNRITPIWSVWINPVGSELVTKQTMDEIKEKQKEIIL
jgi:hypothetical protein